MYLSSWSILPSVYAESTQRYNFDFQRKLISLLETFLLSAHDDRDQRINCWKKTLNINRLNWQVHQEIFFPRLFFEDLTLNSNWSMLNINTDGNGRSKTQVNGQPKIPLSLTKMAKLSTIYVDDLHCNCIDCLHNGRWPEFSQFKTEIYITFISVSV